MWRRHQVNKQTAHRQFENPVDTMPDGVPISPISDKDPIAKYDASMDSGAVSIAFDNPGYNSLRGNKNNNYGKNGNANTEPLGNTAVTNPTYGFAPNDKIEIAEKPPLNDSDFINAELQPVEANGGPEAKIPAGDYVDPDSVKFEFQDDVLKGEASSV
ncbi:unnamed protein product [Owenia fusiformis]|uniref:Uncharacterized protein n=1 Tax=Owenia fusiformis TaxID=6347 RepID=A0A8S4PAM2_OWEFU|nr:unnamed protein product [Owenia fusiformis]